MVINKSQTPAICVLSKVAQAVSHTVPSEDFTVYQKTNICRTRQKMTDQAKLSLWFNNYLPFPAKFQMLLEKSMGMEITQEFLTAFQEPHLEKVAGRSSGFLMKPNPFCFLKL